MALLHIVPSSRPPATIHRLADILRALPQGELEGLIGRLGVRIDPAKRIDVPSQVARALVSLPELRDPSRLAPATLELVHRVAEANGSLVVASVPPALEPLIARGLMFARMSAGDGIELILPAAFLIQLKTWEGEDPRALRALLSQAPFETMSAIAANYLGRPATPPIALALESAWETLGHAGKLAEEIAKLSPTEKRVLTGVDADGGEVDTEELLELEREPFRLRTATGATPSRRGVGFSLERRGLLMPVHPNRHVVSDRSGHDCRGRKPPRACAAARGGPRVRPVGRPLPEACALLAGSGAACARSRRHGPGVGVAHRRRAGAVWNLLGPSRRRRHTEVAHPEAGNPIGRDPNQVALLFSLSRAIGLWDASATNTAAPPGSFTLNELTEVLFATWRRGGAWDEARLEPEVMRVASDSRDSSPAGVLREIVILRALCGARRGSVAAMVFARAMAESDGRMAGLSRLLRRWAGAWKPRRRRAD